MNQTAYPMRQAHRNDIFGSVYIDVIYISLYFRSNAYDAGCMNYHQLAIRRAVKKGRQGVLFANISLIYGQLWTRGQVTLIAGQHQCTYLMTQKT